MLLPETNEQLGACRWDGQALWAFMLAFIVQMIHMVAQEGYNVNAMTMHQLLINMGRHTPARKQSSPCAVVILPADFEAAYCCS